MPRQSPQHPLMLLPSTGIGGCEVFFGRLVESVIASHRRVSLALPDVGEVRRLINAPRGRRSLYLPWLGANERAGSDWGSFPRQYARACDLLRRTDADFVWMVLPAPEAAVGMMAAAHDLGIPGICVFQLAASAVPVPSAERRRARSALMSGLLPVAVSDDNRAAIAATFTLPPQRIRVIRNAAELRPPPSGDDERAATRRSLGLLPDQMLIITVARLTHQKGYDLLVEVARAWQAAGRSAKFLWLGDGEWRSRLIDATRGLHNVVMAGRVEAEDVRRYLAASDVFVLPSRWEGTPLALSEAMSMGLPVVAAAIGSIGEMVSDTDAALFAAGDAAALDSALRRVVDRPDERRRLGAAALARHASYGPVDMLRLYHALVPEATGRRAARITRCRAAVG